jgi:hypothetical protein
VVQVGAGGVHWGCVVCEPPRKFRTGKLLALSGYGQAGVAVDWPQGAHDVVLATVVDS